MKKFIFIAFFLLTVSISWAQTNSLYFTKNIFQSTELNPARQPKCKVSIGFPIISALYINLLNKNFVYDDFFTQDLSSPDTLKFNPDLDKFYNALDTRNYIFINNKISLGHLGFWANDLYLSYDVNLNNNVNLTIPKSIFSIKDGNYFTDSTYFSATNLALNANSYIEYGIGISKEIIPGLTVGGKFKIYTGIANAEISNFIFDWKVSNEDTSNYEYLFKVGATIHSSFGIEATHDSLGNVNGVNPFVAQNLENFISDFQTNHNLPLKDIFNHYNLGFGIDLGLIYKLNNQFEFSASLIDLGFITWKNYPFSMNISEKEFAFSGLDIGKYLGNSSIFEILMDPNLSDSVIGSLQSDMIDTLISLVRPIDDTLKYTTPLNTKIHLAAAYSPNDWFSAGILYNGLFFNKKLISSYTFSSSFMFGKGWSYSINYTIFKNSFNNLGMGFSWKILPFQTYIFLDNISIPALATRFGLFPDKAFDQGIATSWVKNTRMLNLQFGINLMFGCKQSKDLGLID